MNTNTGKMLASYIIAAKELLPIIYNKLLQINKQKMNSPAQKRTNYMKRQFAREEIQMAANILPVLRQQLGLLQLL